MYSIHSTSTKNTESSVLFLRNDVLILNGKENKEDSAICFEIRIGKKKNEELLRKVPSKIHEVILIWKKNKKFSLLIFPNIIAEQWGLYVIFYCSKMIRHKKAIKSQVLH